MPSCEGLVWLASYPKSGNTWTRAFLSHYLGPEEAGPADINALNGAPIASDRTLFDEVVGVEAACLLPQEVLTLRPRVYHFLARQAARTGKPLFVKAHDAWQRLPDGGHLFPAGATRAVIYIVRTPLDVAVSWAHHSGLSLEQAVDRLCDEAYAFSDKADDLIRQLPQFLGSWSRHVCSWLDDSGLPVHVMRYEDMLADPAAAFGAMVRFAGLPYDEQRLAAAVDAARFEALQQQESARGFRERRQAATASFFRQGRAGGWREVLPAALAARLLEAHGPTMHRLGYLDEHGAVTV